MAHPFINLSKCYSKLNNFRETQTFTDVTIKCENVEFQCHKVVLAAVSDYFHSLLGGHCKGSAVENVKLQVSPLVFGEILRFAYTGQSFLTSDNVAGVLSASELFLMDDLQDQCVRYVMQNNVSLENVLEVFHSACATKKNAALVQELSEFIVEHLELIYTTEKFLDVANEDLLVILNWWSTFKSSPCPDEKVLMKALVRWLDHAPDARLTYLNQECVETLPATLGFIVQKYATKDHILLSSFIKSEPRPPDAAAVLLEEDTSLHVFAKHKETMNMITYSINNFRKCSVLSIMPLSYSSEWMKSVVLNDSALYCFRHDGDKPKSYYGLPSFRVHTSMNMREGVDLKALPIYHNWIDMCGIQNNIYLCADTGPLSAGPSRKENWLNCTTMNDEEIYRRIYVYNSEVDNWFSVPRMKGSVQMPIITSCHGNVYLFGEESYFGKLNFQALDYRTGEWRQLPQFDSFNCNCVSQCATLNGKVYLFADIGDVFLFANVYDPLAGKWRQIESLEELYVHKVAPYADRLWAVNGDITNFKVYEPLSDKWHCISLLLEGPESKFFNPAQEGSGVKFIEAVSFKTL